MKSFLLFIPFVSIGFGAEESNCSVDGGKATLQRVGHLPSQGCNGIEFFEADATLSKLGFLAVANFWDGSSRDMGAKSSLFSTDEDDGDFGTTLRQEFDGKGAHGVDSFQMGDYRFLTIPSYYGCDKKNDLGCKSTHLYKFDQLRETFVLHQALHTQGPSQTDHLISPGGSEALLFVAENFANRVSIWGFNSNTQLFEHNESLGCPGVAAIALSRTREIYGEPTYLAAASYHDNGWETESLLFIKKQEDTSFKLFQKLLTHGAHDAEMLVFNGSIFLFMSEDRVEETPKINSQLFVLDDKVPSGLFVKVQDISTDGAHAAELFVSKNSQLFLAVANFGDRLGGRILSMSSLFRWTDGRMVLQQDIGSFGATDFEHFHYRGEDYLVLCNEGDIAAKGIQEESPVFILRDVIEDASR